MQALFRRHCDALVSSYVNASLARGAEAKALHAALDDRACKDKTRRRIASLEHEIGVTNRLVEDLLWEIEQLNFRVNSIERRRPGSPAKRADSLETSQKGVDLDVQRKKSDDLEWTQI
jgi:hypothetical protein